MSSKICLTLTYPTIRQNLEALERFRSYVDIAELRADFLEAGEYPYIRSFPGLAGLPCILTVRRKSDGGNFTGGEGARAVVFAHGLAFADTDPKNNFAYIDLEDDFQVSSIEEVARGFGIKIIRSLHNMTGMEKDIAAKMREMRRGKDEMVKIAVMPESLADVTALFKAAKLCRGEEFTLIGMGRFGLPTRALASVMGSQIAYCSVPADSLASSQAGAIGQIDVVALNEVYNFRDIAPDADIYGVAGYPLEATSSPVVHNAGFREHKKNAIFIPIRAETFSEVMDFAEELGVKGLAVTHPFKEEALSFIGKASAEVEEIGAANTLAKRDGAWHGFNTDVSGFSRAILEFAGKKDLSGMNTAIIGAGGAARAIALAVRRLKGRACVFNRTAEKARALALQHGFEWAALDSSNASLLAGYSDLIIQTTSAGMLPETEKDPLAFYSFSGREAVFDIIYTPEKTKMLLRAEEAGCKVSGGFSMLKYQAHDQFKLFTGEDYAK